jgi:hypothetical protein
MFVQCVKISLDLSAFTSAKRSLFRKRPYPSRPLGTSAIRMTPLQVAPTTLSRADPPQLHPHSDMLPSVG